MNCSVSNLLTRLFMIEMLLTHFMECYAHSLPSLAQANSSKVRDARTCVYDIVKLTMSHHYTTKALGRVWAPSPTASPRISSRGRFDTARPRQSTVAQDSWFQDLRILRGRLIERLGVLLALMVCAAYLFCHYGQLVEPATHLWTASLQRLRVGGSLLPSWSRVDWSSYANVSYATS